MLTILETLKAQAADLLAKFRAGIAHTEEEFTALVEKAEEAIGLHKAATDEDQPAVHVIGDTAAADSTTTDPAPAVPGIEVTEGAPVAETTTADAAPAPTDPAPAA